MPIQTLPGSGITYYLIAFDADGRERTDDPDGLMSQRAADLLAAEPVTDVFIPSHGWMGAVPEAERQYAKWVGAMAEARAGIDRLPGGAARLPPAGRRPALAEQAVGRRGVRRRRGFRPGTGHPGTGCPGTDR